MFLRGQLLQRAVRQSAMRRLMRMRSSSVSSGQRVTSSNVRKQLRHTSSPSAVVQWPVHGHWEVTSGEKDVSSRCMAHYTSGRVACSSRLSHASASSRELPHISADGCRPAQNAGRPGWPNTLQRNSSSSCTQGTAAGLPWGMPGRGEVIEGAMQQAAQWGRQMVCLLGEFTDKANRVDEAMTLNRAGQVKQLRGFSEFK